MKMGINEFRERIGELAMGDETVVITHHGRRVGRYIPDRFREPKEVDAKAWIKEREEFGRSWRATTPDWQERLRTAGSAVGGIEELKAPGKCS